MISALSTSAKPTPIMSTSSVPTSSSSTPIMPTSSQVQPFVILPASVKKGNITNHPISQEYCGPTDESNWIIPHKILASAYPSAPYDHDGRITRSKIKSMYDAGIRHIVCLQTKSELSKFYDYTSIVQEFSGLTWLNFEIPDNSSSDDPTIDAFTDRLVDMYHRSHVFMVHCWGGHGRTNLISAIVLGKIYSLNSKVAIRHVCIYHRCRRRARCEAFSGSFQRAQVRRLLNYRSQFQAQLQFNTDAN